MEIGDVGCLVAPSADSDLSYYFSSRVGPANDNWNRVDVVSL